MLCFSLGVDRIYHLSSPAVGERYLGDRLHSVTFQSVQLLDGTQGSKDAPMDHDKIEIEILLLPGCAHKVAVLEIAEMKDGRGRHVYIQKRSTTVMIFVLRRSWETHVL